MRVRAHGHDDGDVRHLPRTRAASDLGTTAQLVTAGRRSGSFASARPTDVLAAQRTVGNAAVQRMVSVQRDDEVPSITHLKPMEQTLLQGALEKTDVDAAVRQIYDNMHRRTGWKYNASITNINGLSYTQGSAAVGMCESYRNAFAEALFAYDALRKTHPNPAVKNGALRVEKDDSLAAERFATRTGLTLMGRGVRGNVYAEVDGGATPTASGLGDINTFVFKGHWTTKVNGVVFDPIFHSIGEDNVGRMLDGSYKFGAGRYLHDQTKPIPTGEFGATFVYVADFATFDQSLTDLQNLYTGEKATIDKILAGKKKTTSGFFKKKERSCYREAKALAANVSDPTNFVAILRGAAAVLNLRNSQIDAVQKVLNLAAL